MSVFRAIQKRDLFSTSVLVECIEQLLLDLWCEADHGMDWPTYSGANRRAIMFFVCSIWCVTFLIEKAKDMPYINVSLRNAAECCGDKDWVKTVEMQSG